LGEAPIIVAGTLRLVPCAGCRSHRGRRSRSPQPQARRRALSDGISCVAVEAGTDGLVTKSIADGVDTTHSGTRVHTLAGDTGSLAWAVCVEDTLRSAGQVRATLLLATLGVRTAGQGLAGVVGSTGLITPGMREHRARVALVTFADTVVVGSDALRIDSACSWVGVHTRGPDARFVAPTVS